jgi:hypothetical protein
MSVGRFLSKPNTMKNEMQLFGIHAKLNIIEMKHGLGILKELVFTCSKEVGEKIIQEGVKRGFPFERTNEGVKLYN